MTDPHDSRIEYLENQIDSLKAALEKCAEALKEIDDDLKENMPEYERLDSTQEALSNPTVQAILKGE